MNFKEKLTSSGIIIPNSDGKLEGIHARWGRVYAVGDRQQDVRVGQYVLVKHGRWTRGTLIEDSEGEKTIRRVDDTDILLVSDDPMQDETIGQGL
jgi:co-chaperonin GroES (HSP10)